MIERDYTPFFKSFEEAINDLEDERTQLKLYRAIVRYGLYGETPELDGLAATLWKLIYPNLRNNRKQFENGLKGGAPIGSSNNPNGRRGNERTNPKLTQVEPKTNPELNYKEKDKEIIKENTPLTGVKESTKRTAFVPPSLDEISAYISEKGYSVDAERFFNFYEAKGWMIGKNRMKSWKAAVANWEKDEKEKSSAKKERATPQQPRPAKLNYDEDFYGNSSGADKPKPERNYDEGF